MKKYLLTTIYVSWISCILLNILSLLLEISKIFG